MTERELYQNFGANLKRLRNQNGLSQQELAEMAQMERSNLAAIESGSRGASFATIAKLSTCLACCPIEFFSPLARSDTDIAAQSLDLTTRAHDNVKKLVKDYRQLKTAVTQIKTVLGEKTGVKAENMSDINIELLSLLPFLSFDAQTLLRKFAEGYLEAAGETDGEGRRIAKEILGPKVGAGKSKRKTTED